MTTRQDRLRALAALAAMLEKRAAAPVAAAEARMGRAKAEVTAIRQAREHLAADARDPLQAAMMARQADRLRHRQAEALSELAARQAALEIAKAGARPAVGRRIVLDRLLAERSRKS
jgi:hypothetical protein